LNTDLIRYSMTIASVGQLSAASFAQSSWSAGTTATFTTATSSPISNTSGQVSEQSSQAVQSSFFIDTFIANLPNLLGKKIAIFAVNVKTAMRAGRFFRAGNRPQNL
jgi:hypothetical protein